MSFELNESSIIDPERIIGRRQPNTARRLYTWYRVVETPRHIWNLGGIEHYQADRVRSQVRRLRHRQAQNRRVLLVDSRDNAYRYHFYTFSQWADPLGSIPRRLLDANLEQIVVGIPEADDTERVNINLVIQLPFEEVYNFITSPAA